MKIMIAFGVLFILGLVGLTYLHEQVHIAIYSSYGIESHAEYFKYFPKFVTIPESNCPTEMCSALNNLNEIVGYPLMVFYVVFGLGLFFIISLLEKEKYIKESRY